MKINKPMDPIDVKMVKMLIYGQPGIRKTSFAFSGTKTLLLDTDGGIQRLHPRYRGENVSVRTWNDIADLFVDPQIKNYDNLVIDTAGRALDFLATAIINENPKLSYQGGLSQQGWGVLKNRFQLWLTQIEQLNIKGLTFIAHDVEKGKGDDTVMRPDIAGGSMKVLVRVMDLVGYMEALNNTSTINFDISDRYWSKNSCNVPKIMDITKTTIDDIHRMFHDQQATTNQMAGEYEMLMSQIPEIIDAMTTDIKTVHAAAEALNKLPVIWDSKAQGQQQFFKKLGELKLKYNKESMAYEIMS